MSCYQHRRGKIIDNALEALLHDPLFKQRVQRNKKGKGSYQRKAKGGNKDWEANGKSKTFTIGLLVSGALITGGYSVL